MQQQILAAMERFNCDDPPIPHPTDQAYNHYRVAVQAIDGEQPPHQYFGIRTTHSRLAIDLAMSAYWRDYGVPAHEQTLIFCLNVAFLEPLPARSSERMLNG